MKSNPFRVGLASLAAVSAAAILAFAAAAQAQQTATPAANQARAASARASASADNSVDGWFTSMDKDRNGQLSLIEFKAGLLERSEQAFEQRLQGQFKAMDANNSGFLEASEFNALPILKTVHGTAPTLAEVDASGDGKINFDEYLGLLSRVVKSKTPAKP